MELLGDKGGVKIGGTKTILRTEVDGMIADTELFFKRDQDRFVIQLEKFVAAVQGKGDVPATGEQGVILMEILDAIYKSSEEDSEVTI